LPTFFAKSRDDHGKPSEGNRLSASSQFRWSDVIWAPALIFSFSTLSPLPFALCELFLLSLAFHRKPVKSLPDKPGKSLIEDKLSSNIRHFVRWVHPDPYDNRSRDTDQGIVDVPERLQTIPDPLQDKSSQKEWP
jgi:hypothetical protein